MIKDNLHKIETKVFCIGAPKTGTTSIHHALERIGFDHKTWDKDLWRRYKKGDVQAVYEVAEQFDSFDDGPWNNDDLYKELDQRFPGSKFILTEREPESWIRSHEAHFSAVRLRNHPYLLWRRRYSQRKKQKTLKRYLDRNRAIKSYFQDRPDDLLIMNVCRGEGWEKLCPFLGIPTLDEPFPRENVTETKDRSTIAIWRSLIAHWKSRLVTRVRSVISGVKHL